MTSYSTNLNMLSQLWKLFQGDKGVIRFFTTENEEAMYQLHIHELPDFLILKIFKFLCIREKLLLRRVSKKWYELLSDFSIWKSIKIHEEIMFAHKIDTKILREWIDEFGPTIQCLDMSYADWITDEDVIHAARACANLRCLILRSCAKVTDASIVEVARKCTKLRRVNVFLTAVTSSGFEEITIHCSQLESVKLGCLGNTCKMLQLLCKNGNGLKYISLQDVVPDNANEPTLKDALVKKMALKFPSLCCINLTWCCYITNQSLKDIISYCTILNSLKLRECPQVTDEGVKAVLQNGFNLRRLCLERLYGITDDISTTTDSCLGKLLTLKIFDTKMTDVGIALLSERCTELRRLCFGEYSFHPKFIQGTSVQSVARYCIKLRKLQVYCQRIRNEELQAIGEHLNELTYLSIGDCQECSGTVVVKMAQRCKYLKYLSIKNCNDVNERHACIIRSTLKYLRTFELPGNTEILPFGSLLFVGNSMGHLFE